MKIRKSLTVPLTLSWILGVTILVLLNYQYPAEPEEVLTRDQVIEQTVLNTFMVSTEPKIEGDTRPILRTLLGHGTGFTYLTTETEGLVITNYHVIAKHLSRPELTTLKLYMINRPWAYPAEVVGFDKVTDIAVLRIKKVDDENWVGLDWNLDSKNYLEGTPVITVGHGLSLPYTVTEGVISGTDRFRSRKLNFLLQHSAIINVGNSGGPVVGLDGRVIAVNSMIVSPSSTGSGIAAWDGVAMAVAGWQAIYSIEQIIENGKVLYSKIDFETRSPTIEEVHKQDACYEGDRSKRSYAYLVVGDDSTEAIKSGLQTDDVMISIEGEPVFGIASIAKAVIDKKPNTSLTFGFLRDCEYMETEYRIQLFEPFKIVTGPVTQPPELLPTE